MSASDGHPDMDPLQLRLDALHSDIEWEQTRFAFFNAALILLPEDYVERLVERIDIKLCVTIDLDGEDPLAVLKLQIARLCRRMAGTSFDNGDHSESQAMLDEGEKRIDSVKVDLAAATSFLNALYRVAPQQQVDSWHCPVTEEQWPEKWRTLKALLAHMPANREAIALGLSSLDDIVNTFVRRVEEGVGWQQRVRDAMRLGVEDDQSHRAQENVEANQTDLAQGALEATPNDPSQEIDGANQNDPAQEHVEDNPIGATQEDVNSNQLHSVPEGVEPDQFTQMSNNTNQHPLISQGTMEEFERLPISRNMPSLASFGVPEVMDNSQDDPDASDVGSTVTSDVITTAGNELEIQFLNVHISGTDLTEPLGVTHTPASTTTEDNNDEILPVRLNIADLTSYIDPATIITVDSGMLRRDELSFAFDQNIETDQPIQFFFPDSWSRSRSGAD